MTWEAVGVIVTSLAGFATTVSGLAWLIWKRFARLDREASGDFRISRSDKRALTLKETPDPWWG